MVWISKISEVNKNNLKIRKKILILDIFSDYVGPWNYVSKIPRGTGCIAPKLRGAQVEGSKNPQGKGWGVHNSAGQILKEHLPRGVLDPSTCARRVLDPSTCAPRSFGAMQPVPRRVLET